MRSKSNWNLEVLVFKERGKPDYMFLEKNLSEQGREPTTNSTHIWHQHMPVFELRSHWWEKSALTTKPPFLQINDNGVRTRGVWLKHNMGSTGGTPSKNLIWTPQALVNTALKAFM